MEPYINLGCPIRSVEFVDKGSFNMFTKKTPFEAAMNSFHVDQAFKIPKRQPSLSLKSLSGPKYNLKENQLHTVIAEDELLGLILRLGFPS